MPTDRTANSACAVYTCVKEKKKWWWGVCLLKNLGWRALNKQCECLWYSGLFEIKLYFVQVSLGVFSHRRALLSIAKVVFLCYKFLELKPEKQVEPSFQETL